MAATATRVPPGAVGSSGDQTSWWLTSAVFRDDAGRHEFQLAINETGRVTVRLFGPEIDAFGVGTATLVPVSRSSATCAATIVLTGHDVGSDRLHHLEIAVGATWAVDRSDRTKVEVSGTALLTDLDENTLVRYQAVRRHPFNHLDLAALSPVPELAAVAGEPCRPREATGSSGRSARTRRHWTY